MELGDVRLRLDLGKLEAKVAPMCDAAVKRAAIKATQSARDQIAAEGLIDTGQLMNSMRWQSVAGGLFPKYAVGSPLDHAKFLEFGTRAHGPVTAKALRFKPKGSNKFIFVTWVRGVRPYRFMQHTLDHIRPTDFLE